MPERREFPLPIRLFIGSEIMLNSIILAMQCQENSTVKKQDLPNGSVAYSLFLLTIAVAIAIIISNQVVFLYNLQSKSKEVYFV